MDCKRIQTRSRKKLEWFNSVGKETTVNVKDTDSGISSTSSIGISDLTDLSLCTGSCFKITNNIIFNKAFLPVVKISRSAHTESLIEIQKRKYLHALDLCANGGFDSSSFNKTETISGLDPKHIPDSESVNINKGKGMNETYKLRRNVNNTSRRRKITKEVTLEHIKVDKNLNSELAIINSNSENLLHNEEITRHIISGDCEPYVNLIPLGLDLNVNQNNNITQINEVPLKRKIGNQRKRKKSNKRRLNITSRKLSRIMQHRKKLWKRENDMALDAIVSIASDNRIFRGAELHSEDSIFSVVNRRIYKLPVQLSRSITSPLTSPNKLNSTCREDIVDDSCNSSPHPMITITLNSEVNERKVQKNFSSQSSEASTTCIADVFKTRSKQKTRCSSSGSMDNNTDENFSADIKLSEHRKRKSSQEIFRSDSIMSITHLPETIQTSSEQSDSENTSIKKLNEDSQLKITENIKTRHQSRKRWSDNPSLLSISSCSNNGDDGSNCSHILTPTKLSQTSKNDIVGRNISPEKSFYTNITELSDIMQTESQRSSNSPTSPYMISNGKSSNIIRLTPTKINNDPKCNTVNNVSPEEIFDNLLLRQERFNTAYLRDSVDKPITPDLHISSSKLEKNSSWNGDKPSTLLGTKRSPVNANVNGINVVNHCVTPRRLFASPCIESQNSLEFASNSLDKLETYNTLNHDLQMKPMETSTDSRNITYAFKINGVPNHFKPNLLDPNRNNQIETLCHNKSTRTQFDLRNKLNKRNKIFKTPVLPLMKRPPSRIPPGLRQGVPFKKPIEPPPSTAAVDGNEQDFDAISLFAESLCEVMKSYNNLVSKSPDINDRISECQEMNPYVPGDVECVMSSDKEVSEALTPLQDLNCIPIEECSSNSNVEHTMTSIVKGSGKLSIENAILTKTDQEENHMTPAEMSYNSTCNNVERDTSKVDRWIASSANENSLTVPDYILTDEFRRLCRYYFTSGTCIHKNCWFHHDVPTSFKNLIKYLNNHQFKALYNFALGKPYLFTELFHLLLDQIKDQERALINMINDIVKVTKFEKKPYVIAIISALQNLGFSFDFALDEILAAYGKRHDWLLDILLDIAVQNNECLINNWSLIQKLTLPRRLLPDCGVISDIFNKCINSYPPSKEFCINVYNDLIITDKLNLLTVTQDKVTKYVNLLCSFGLIDYANRVRNTYKIRSNNAVVTIPQRTSDKGSSKSLQVNSHFPSNSYSESVSQSRCESANSIEHRNTTNLLKGSQLNVNKDCTIINSSRKPDAPFINEESVEKNIPVKSSTIFMGNSSGITNSTPYEEYITNSYQPVNNSYSYKPQSPDNQDYYEEYDPLTSNFTNGIPHNSPSVSSDSDSNNSSWGKEASSIHSQPTSSEATRKVNRACNDVTDEDIIKLKIAINAQNMSDVLSLFQKYSETHLSKEFIIHLIAALKHLNSKEVAGYIVRNIFSSLESLSLIIITPPNLVTMLELFGLNILPFLDMYKIYDVAVFVLNRFSSNFAEFITTQCIIPDFEYFSTTELRYIFVLKIYTRSGKLKEALKLLKSHELRLYENLFTEEITLNYLDYKKRIISEFIEATLKNNITIAKDMLCFLIFNVSCFCDHIDVEKYLNQLVICMLNRYNEFRDDLIGIFEIIRNSWYKYLQKGVLRALLIQLYNELPDWKILEFYHVNASLEVYQIHEGNKNSITIPSNMLKEEIAILLHLYFHNICKSNFPIKSILIEIEPVVQEEPEVAIAILTNSRTNYTEMKSRILNVLQKFPNPPVSHNDYERCISLSFEDLHATLLPYKSEKLPPLIKFR